MLDPFATLNLTPRFDLDLSDLEERYRALQSAAHPDRFVTASPTERLYVMQKATAINDAYRVLKDPALRAGYLLAQQGRNVLDERNTALPVDFLQRQMLWREAIDEAQNNPLAQQALLAEFVLLCCTLEEEIASNINAQPDLAEVATRKLIFMQKLCQALQESMVS